VGIVVTDVEVLSRRGWDIVQLRSTDLVAEVVPGKGGDVLSLRWRPTGVELLWQSPWGLRARGAATTSEDPVARLIEAYPGGWQTVFPNGGDAVLEHGVDWGMHGEVWLTPLDWEPVADGLVMRARLVRSPFEVEKRVTMAGRSMTVAETVTNMGGDEVEVMSGHHPAFGAPLVGPDTVVETAARVVVVDDVRNTPGADLALGAIGSWPLVPGRAGADVDLSRVPGPGAGVDRFAYLTDLERGHAAIDNPRLGLRVDLTWEAAALPHAWYWLEANGTAGFPWYRGVYVLAIEPATSFPGQGIGAVRAKTGTQVAIPPGGSRTSAVTLTVSTSG
jgi:galactose mutarotase-like enzyme